MLLGSNYIRALPLLGEGARLRSGCKRRESSFADKTVPGRLHRFPDRPAAVLGSQAKEDDGVIGVGAPPNDRIRMQQYKFAGKAVGRDIASEQLPLLLSATETRLRS